MAQYYATFNGIRNKEIAVFNTKEERDSWVKFQDAFSKAFGVTKETATFGRKPVSRKWFAANEARYGTSRNDGFNNNQIWKIA